jgi:AcrR family transcriptional regulator
MARTRSPDYDTLRDSILQNAVRAFAQLGYPSASMADLAKICGTSKAGLYHYYPSKEALLFDCLNRHTLRLVKLSENASGYSSNYSGELKALVVSFLQEYRSAHDSHVSLLHDLKFLPIAQQEVIREQERTVTDRFAYLIQKAFPGKITPRNLKPLTMSLLGAMNFTFAWLRTDGAISYEQYAHWIADLWIAGLAAGKFDSLPASIAPVVSTV